MRHSRENTKKEENNTQDISTEKMYQSSEAIVKVILDKVITLALYEAYSTEISQNLGDFCFDHIKKEMTSLFELNFINYTKKNKDKNSKEDDILWEIQPPPENTWVEIFEPESESMDRYESSKICYHEIKKENELQEKEKENKNNNIINNKNKKISAAKNNKNKNRLELNNLNNNNIINEVEEKSGMSSFGGEVKIGKDLNPEISGIEDKSSHSLDITDAEIKKNIDNVDINDNNNLKTKTEEQNNINNNIIKREERKVTKRITTIKPQETLPPITKKSRNTMISIYPSIDIPGVEQEYNHDSLEPSNVELLRQERQEAIQKKLIEMKNEKVMNKTKKNIIDNDKKPKKIFDNKHLTFDSNGNIINFHPYKLDNLKKEFTLIKNLIKGSEQNQEGPKTRKRNFYIKENSRNSPKKIEEDKNIKEIIEKPEQMFEEITTKEKERYIPSGSNFQIISPNYGVVIKENNRFKYGSKEFSKYFKKYSIQDYDKMLNDYVPLQNKTLLKNQLKTLNSYSSNNINYTPTSPNSNSKTNMKLSTLNKKASNTLATSYDFNNNNNPLLSDAQGVNNSGLTNLNININNISSTNNPLLSSNYNTINYNNNSQNSLNINSNRNEESYKSINNEKSIIMKKMGSGSLKLELDSLKDLSNISSVVLNRTNINKTKNIFRYNSHKNYMNNETKNNAFTEFNKNIMNSREWGNDFSSKKSSNKMGYDDNNIIYSRHMTKQQVLRELGSNILSGIKIKLPRRRKVELNDNI